MNFVLLWFTQVGHDLVGEAILNTTEEDVLKIFKTKSPFTSAYLTAKEVPEIQKFMDTKIELDHFAYRLEQKPTDRMALTTKLEVLLLAAVKKNGYAPKEVMSLIEDVINDEEKQTATKFLAWTDDMIALTPNLVPGYRYTEETIHHNFAEFRKWTR